MCTELIILSNCDSVLLLINLRLRRQWTTALIQWFNRYRSLESPDLITRGGCRCMCRSLPSPFVDRTKGLYLQECFGRWVSGTLLLVASESPRERARISLQFWSLGYSKRSWHNEASGLDCTTQERSQSSMGTFFYYCPVHCSKRNFCTNAIISAYNYFTPVKRSKVTKQSPQACMWFYHLTICFSLKNWPVGLPGGSRAKTTGVSAPTKGVSQTSFLCYLDQEWDELCHLPYLFSPSLDSTGKRWQLQNN